MDERFKLQLIQNLIDRFEYIGEEEFILDSELDHLSHPVTREPLEEYVRIEIEGELLKRINYKRSHDGAILQPVSVVSDPRLHEEWYEGWLSENNDFEGSYYWKRLEDYLSTELSRKYGADEAGRVVRSIDEATYNIMSNLSSPRRKDYSYKGLVVGYVQSGKTANFTALIAKAADAGYKLIIVLAGIHNILRRQTQIRLDREITGYQDVNGSDKYISMPGNAKLWKRITNAHHDFSISNNHIFENHCQVDNPTLAVVKKNVSVLNSLIEYISLASDDSRRDVPVLIIDDEADQASIDTNANNEDIDPSSTNDCIRELLSLFPRKAYVGYTATPFANVLVSMSEEHDELEDDLYPRNFIVSLPEPDGYFGTSAIFSSELSESFVRNIPDESESLIDEGVMPQNLSDAIDQFLICCSIRNLRGDRMKPMSMLVHISHRILDMSVVNEIVTDYFDTICERYLSPFNNRILKEEFKQLWADLEYKFISINSGLGLERLIPEFDQVWEEMAVVLEVVRILELNSGSDDRLNYDSGEEIKVIAIGGNQLSRGLTLEGLMTSYYLRASRQYDTLLQMGRWFGYRQNYEDLTSVFTTELIWDFFEHLALVEDELRSEIARYEEEDKTPMEMAVAIRAHRNLRVTAKNKIGAARVRQSSYSNSLNQTIWFPLDQPEILRGNLNLGTSFIRRIYDNGGFTWKKESGVFLANDLVDGQVVFEQFLRRYSFVDKQSTGGPGVDDAGLLEYISRRLSSSNPELLKWSIGVVSNQGQTAPDDPFLFGGLEINRIQRSRKHTETGYNIGVLTEPAHLVSDIGEGNRRSNQNPLLLIYLIWKDSLARKQLQNPTYGRRIDLYRNLNVERIDVMGVAIVLPVSEYEPDNYIGQ